MHAFAYIILWCAVQYAMCGPWEWLTLLTISTVASIFRPPKSIAATVLLRTIAVIGFDLVYQQEHYQDIGSDAGFALEIVARIVLFNVTLLPLDLVVTGFRRSGR